MRDAETRVEEEVEGKKKDDTKRFGTLQAEIRFFTGLQREEKG